MPFNVATIKDKAIAAKDITVSKVQRTRDRHTSTPMAKTKFSTDGYMPDARKNPPPPPPARPGSYARDSDPGSSRTSDGASHRFPPPPPPPPAAVSRGTKPTLGATTSSFPVSSPPNTGPPPLPPSANRLRAANARQAQTVDDSDQIDWVNLSPEDKQAFFEWLDEFFARFLRIKDEPPWRKDAIHPTIHIEHQKPATANNTWPPAEVSAAVDLGRSPPPAIKKWSKPTLSQSASEFQSNEFETSYPPATTYGSQALDLACYFHPDMHWDTAWYTDEGSVPPPLRNNPMQTYKGYFTMRGDQRSVHFGVMFADLSLCWVGVSYSSSYPSDVLERTARYLAPPAPLDHDLLMAAHETYGGTIASFAESFVGSGQFCARGECWDLADEALKYVAQFSYIAPPVLSLSRTHGHLVFVGRADGGTDRQAGRWRGGDDRVRRGDIVEWRSTRIKKADTPWGGYSVLGDPEHTAVITADTVPSCTPRDGESLLPRELGQLEVVEQSRNALPEKNVYDMKTFEQGEVWIYRPIAMETYLGIKELTHIPPAHALSL